MGQGREKLILALIHFENRALTLSNLFQRVCFTRFTFVLKCWLVSELLSFRGVAVQADNCLILPKRPDIRIRGSE